MAFSYNRLWKLLIDKGMTKTALRKAAHFGTTTLARMGKGEPIAMETLDRICSALSCQLEDIVERTEDELAPPDSE